MADHKINPRDHALCINGEDVDPILMGHDDHISASKDFRFFYLK